MGESNDTPNKKRRLEDFTRLTGLTEPSKSIKDVAELLKTTPRLGDVIPASELLTEYVAPPEKLNLAEWAYERIVEYIKDFERELDEEHEIGARLVSFGSTVIFRINDIGYYGPDIISFYGQNEEGQKVQLIQNISQLSVLLVALKKLEEKPRRLGFMLDKKKSDEPKEE